MKSRIAIVALALGLSILGWPSDAGLAPVDSAAAEVCHAGDLDCYERKAQCIARTATHPTDPALCTQ